MHLARFRLLFAVVVTLLRSGRLSLTSLGRAIATQTSAKHGIKRIDRLLGNEKLHREQLLVYGAIAKRLIAPGSQPVVLVDWTAVTATLWALVAAVCFDGRALIIYAETHPISRYLKPEVNAELLRQLALVLPHGCSPVIVADAGFRSPWMKLVAGFGWDYVVRARAPAKVRHDRTEAWVEIEDVWRYTRSKPSDLGEFEVGRKVRHRCRFVGVRKRARRMARPSIRDFGRARQLRNAREPWILATSLTCSAAKVVAIYKRRMQIEETFRDAKSTRFGFSLSHARTRSDDRGNILLLLAALAHLVSILLGIAAETSRANLRFQANTVTSRRVLSLAMLGRLVASSSNDEALEQSLSPPCWTLFSLQAYRVVAA
jgi:hypothetical protein